MRKNNMPNPTYDFSKLHGLVLSKGNHEVPAQGACVMETISMVENGDTPFSDDPPCMRNMPHRRQWCMRGNDMMPDAERQRFLPLIPRLMEPCDSAKAKRELRVLVLEAVREFVPLALDKAGLGNEAAKLRALPEHATYGDMEKAARAAALAAEATWAALAKRGAADTAAADWAAEAADAAADVAWASRLAAADAALAALAADAADAADAALAAAHVAAGAARAAVHVAWAAGDWDLYFKVTERMLDA